METEIFSESNVDSAEEPKTNVCKISFAVTRIIVCSAILLILALFKYFNPKIYSNFGEWYELNFKSDTISVENLKNCVQDKIVFAQETLKDKINNL